MIGAIVLLISAGAFGISLVAQAADHPVPLVGQTVPLIAQAQLKGPQIAVSARISRLGCNCGTRLSWLVYYVICTPGLVNISSIFDPTAISAAFAPTSDQQQQVVDFLRSRGLTVTSVAPNGLLIDARAALPLFKQPSVCKSTVTSWEHRIFYANATPPVIPSSLSSLILSIGGWTIARSCTRCRI